MVTLYGIRNCDTVRKARAWLQAEGIEYNFHDFRADGLSSGSVSAWLEELGWETLVNKRSSSWKALDGQLRKSMNETRALTAILDQPTLIKRPLLDTGKQRFCGFTPERYRQIFSHHTL